MKKTIILSFAAALALASCAKVAPVPEPQPQPQPQPGETVIAFEASASDCTKTVLTDNVKTYWCPGDAISVFDGSANKRFTTDITVASAAATFSGEASASSVYYAVYPYNASATLSGATVTTVLPNAQVAQVNGYDPAAVLLAATTTTTAMQFKPSVTLLKMQLPEGAVSVAVAGNAEENIAGNVAITVSDNVTVSGGSQKIVTLRNSDNSALAASTNYYVAVKPDTYASGLTVTLTNAEGKTIVKTSEKSHTLVAGVISDMGLIDGEWDPQPAPTDYMIFADHMENGWVLGGTSGKYEISSEESFAGSKSIKWTLDDTNSWARILTLAPASALVDLSGFTGLEFKMKLVGSTFAQNVTMFQNRPYGVDSESFYNVMSPAVDGWVTITQKFSDFNVQSGSDLFTKLNNFCFHTVGWFAGTAVVYIDEIKLIGGTPTPPAPDEDLHIFTDSVADGWALGGTEGKVSISTAESYEGSASIKWDVDAYDGWARILTLGLAEGNMDVTSYEALSFKMKLTNMSTKDVATFARIQVVGVGGYSEVNVYSSDAADWVEVVYNFSEACASTNLAKFYNLCFYTPGWYAVTGTVYFDDIKLVKAK